MKKNINIKSLIICIITPFLASSISFLLFRPEMNSTAIMNKPFLQPPPIVFQIVWPILYLLMGISLYLMQNSKNGISNDLDYNVHKKKSATKIYYMQLFFNVIWPVIFFKYNLYFIAFLDLIIILSLVIIMFFKFYSIEKTSALLQIPYILWLTFAGYLNFSVYLLNEAF